MLYMRRVNVASLDLNLLGAPTTRSSMNRDAESHTLVLGSQVRTGRNRSAERTEVHLVATTSFHELTFCPSMRTSGLGKEVRHAGKTPSIEAQSRAPQGSGKRLAKGTC